MMRNSTQHRGQETTQLTSVQEDDTKEETPRRKNCKASMAETKTVGEPNRILVRNTSHLVTQDIEALFGMFGSITETRRETDMEADGVRLCEPHNGRERGNHHLHSIPDKLQG